MKHLGTARTTTALAPWLALVLMGGDPPQADDALTRREPSSVTLVQAVDPMPPGQTAPHVAMFGPPPTGRPAISAREINKQLLEAPALPGPHANAKVVLPVDQPVDQFAQDAPVSEAEPSVGEVALPQVMLPPVRDMAMAVAPVDDAWGQIVADPLPEEEYHWDEAARDNFSDYDQFSTLDRPLDRGWESIPQQVEQKPLAQAPAEETPFWRKPAPGAAAPQEVAPWLKREVPLPGPHQNSTEPREPTSTPEFAFPAAPRYADSSDEFREPPTVPLPEMEIDTPLVDQPVPQVTQLPEATPPPVVAQNEERPVIAAPIQQDLAFPVEPLDSGRPKQRSLELEIVARNADAHTQSGFELAGKLAYFSARTEFIKSLRMLSEALDAENRTHVHGEALAAGLLALEESDEFVPRGANLEADIDVALLVDGHNTPVLKETDNATVSPLEARQRYYTFAQQKLAESIEDEVAGSMALYGLGKLYTALSEVSGATPPAAESKAVVFHQAALLAVPQNPMAANEMGVLLAKLGRLEPAREMLIHSLRVAPLPATWHNLAVVHARLGEHELAQLAHDEHVNAVMIAKSQQANPATAGPTMDSPVKWVTPEELASSSTPTHVAQVPQPRQPMQSQAPVAPSTAEPEMNQPQPEAESSWWSRLPLINRNKSSQQ